MGFRVYIFVVWFFFQRIGLGKRFKGFESGCVVIWSRRFWVFGFRLKYDLEGRVQVLSRDIILVLWFCGFFVLRKGLWLEGVRVGFSKIRNIRQGFFCLDLSVLFCRFQVWWKLRSLLQGRFWEGLWDDVICFRIFRRSRIQIGRRSEEGKSILVVQQSGVCVCEFKDIGGISVNG